jgi:hypothetical protein
VTGASGTFAIPASSFSSHRFAAGGGFGAWRVEAGLSEDAREESGRADDATGGGGAGSSSGSSDMGKSVNSTITGGETLIVGNSGDMADPMTSTTRWTATERIIIFRMIRS